MHRRQFLQASAATALALAARPATATPCARREAFRLRYAPHLGMFKHHAEDRIDQIAFMADQGFRAFECNQMRSFSADEQTKIAKALEVRQMEMGVFVANDDGFDAGKPLLASGDPGRLEQFLANVVESVEVAKRVHARWATVVPGTVDARLDPGFQQVNVIEALKRAAEICEPSGLVLVCEPLNFRDHPGLFLVRTGQAYAIMKAVDSPSVKILFDIYHQQISEGNLIPNLERAWDEIAYFQIGDNPGRKEPTTGEIHYANLFRFLRDKGYEGILGMEHGNSVGGKEGELAVIEAYRQCDPAA
jgi:hydroxypyruvate isomerase